MRSDEGDRCRMMEASLQPHPGLPFWRGPKQGPNGGSEPCPSRLKCLAGRQLDNDIYLQVEATEPTGLGLVSVGMPRRRRQRRRVRDNVRPVSTGEEGEEAEGVSSVVLFRQAGN